MAAERGMTFPEPQKTPAPTPIITIRLDPEGTANARVQAAERGLRHQTYLKMINHEALRNGESSPRSAKS